MHMSCSLRWDAYLAADRTLLERPEEEGGGSFSGFRQGSHVEVGGQILQFAGA